MTQESSCFQKSESRLELPNIMTRPFTTVLLLAGGEQGRGQLLKVAQPLQRLLGVLDELCVLLEVPDRLLPPDDVLPPEEGVRLIKAL